MMRRLPRPPLGPMGPPGMRPMRGPPPPYLGGPRGPPGMGMPPMHGMLPPAGIGSVTNSNDPASMDSRLFVGNLNTVALSKEDVENIFGYYGVVVGISVHKGYAFVQFRHPNEARQAGLHENGKVYEGQALDINIVSQPKNRSALKRATAGRSINDTSTKKPRQENAGTNQSLQRTLVTLSSSNPVNKKKTVAASNAVKRALATVTKKTSFKSVKASPTIKKASSASKFKEPDVKVAKSTNNTDILICGMCKIQFTSIHSLAQHKKIPCRLRFSCQCQKKLSQKKDDDDDEPGVLQCAECEAEFSSAWALCQHCVDEHNLSIFKTEEDANSEVDEDDLVNSNEEEEDDD